MSYKILVNPATPRGLESTYARVAVEDARARQAQREAERETERARQARIKEELSAAAERTKERDKKAAERAREIASQRLDVDLRTAFFSQNPAADESTFLRLRQQLRDDHMRRKTSEGFQDLKTRKKAGGQYGNI